MEMRYDQQESLEGSAEQRASNELIKVIGKLRRMGLEEEAASLEQSARRRELREFVGREIKAHSDLAEPLPERLAGLIKQLAQQLHEGDNDSGEF